MLSERCGSPPQNVGNLRRRQICLRRQPGRKLPKCLPSATNNRHEVTSLQEINYSGKFLNFQRRKNSQTPHALVVVGAGSSGGKGIVTQEY